MISNSSTWPEVVLGEVCEFKYGKSLPESKRVVGKVAVYGSNGIIGQHNEAITDGLTIVVGRKGSFGEVNLSYDSCWPIDTTYYIDRTATNADLRWLAYRLTALGLTELNRAAAVPGLNREDAYRKRLLLPPLAEQQRIAVILDQAEVLRAKRRHALAQLDTLTQSLFLEMFGDPARHGWPEKSVAALASNIRTGPFGSQLLHSEFVSSGIAVLGIDNAVQNQFVWGRPRFITEHKFWQLKRYQVSPGDVLITIMGSCGRCAVVPDDMPTAINTKHLCCITLDHTQCLSTYLHACFLLHPHVLHRLGIRERGAVMPGLNMQIIKELVIPVPPLHLQRGFAEQVSAVERLKAAQRASLAKLDALFASLQHRAFQGEL